MKLIAIAAVLALVAGGVDVEAQKRGDQDGSRDHKLIVTYISPNSLLFCCTEMGDSPHVEKEQETTTGKEERDA